MHLDVVDLKDFYASPLGQVVRRLLSARLRARWGRVSGMDVFGFGFPCPYLGAFREEAASVVAMMPSEQGVIAWPDPGARQTVLVEETDLPFLDGTADRILLVHLLESTDDARQLLREVWRALAPNGRLLVVVPNRRGLWARVETTPFGSGQPFSRSQLSRLLRDAWFTPDGWQYALYMPPFNWKFLLKWFVFWERLGLVLWPAFFGVIIVEATKQVYGAVPVKAVKKKRSRRLVPVPAPAGAITTFKRLIGWGTNDALPRYRMPSWRRPESNKH